MESARRPNVELNVPPVEVASALAARETCFSRKTSTVNYQLGLVWGRHPGELRFVASIPRTKQPSQSALDSPEQYVGGSAGGGLVTFPAALNAYPGGELNSGGNTLAIRTLLPDVIVTLLSILRANSTLKWVDLNSQFKVWNPNTGSHSRKQAVRLPEPECATVQGFRVLTNNFWSDGGGRYIFGQAPDLIARANGSISPIHTGSTVSGFEYTHKNTLLYSYYGGFMFSGT